MTGTIQNSLRLLAVTGILAACAAQGNAASLVIVPTFDSTITKLSTAATIESTINTVIATYEADITTPITVYITFKNMTTGVGASSYNNYIVTYSNYLKALTASKTSADDTIALAHLSTGTTNPVTGTTDMLVKSALAKALGLSATVGLPTAAGSSDGTVSVNTSLMNLTRTGTQVATKYDLQTVLMHEIDEVLGLSSTMGQGYTAPSSTYPSPEDLFRYSATAGTRITRPAPPPLPISRSTARRTWSNSTTPAAETTGTG